ncbi:MAG: type I phosphomannose isomerase catalytic subunit [Planctomycetota bacterium]
MRQPPLYPLAFNPIYKDKVWGGRKLESIGRTLPGDSNVGIGESWELVDLATTSASGGGGSAEHSVVRNGPLAGRSINQLITDYGSALIGDLPLSPEGGFPLLLKYLDASQNLSVQVHPSPAYAAANPDAFLKSEAWYIVDCEPGAVIYKGVQPGVTAEQFRAALEQNTDEAVVPLMISVPVRPGDCHYLPSGTCHALGGGILVAEVQTPSDTTFRVYDWGRTGRELHVEAALACIHFGPAGTAEFEHRVVTRQGETKVEQLVRCEFFQIERIWADADSTFCYDISQPELAMVLGGSLSISRPDEPPQAFGRGDTVLLPASLGLTELQAHAQAQWLRVRFPQVAADND